MRAGVVAVLMGGMALMTGVAALAQQQVTVTVRRAEPQRGFDRIRVNKAALGPTPIVVWANGEINPDCTEHQPGATLSILKPPAHGSVKVVHEADFMAYPPQNPRAVCNQRKVPMNHAYYAANPGYAGRDRLVLQGSSDEGRVREITVDIDVR